MSLDTGALVGGRYRLEEHLATGGMGQVWRATDVQLDRAVAVKLLKPEYAADPVFRQRFRDEARHSARIDHNGVARVFDFGEVDGMSFLVMELVDGEPLSQLLHRDGPLSPERTLRLVADVAHALHAAHQTGVIHRDVKPANILVRPDGSVKVADFGIARAAAAASLTQAGTVLGSAHYLSPEQAAGKPVTAASDVYSLGVVAYEALSGRRPFDGDTPVTIAAAHFYDDPRALPAEVPAPVVQLVAQAMAKEPGDRFRTAQAFARAAEATLDRLRRSGSSTAPLPVTADAAPTAVLPATATLSEQARTISPRPRVPRWLIAGVVLAVLLVALAAVLQDRAQPQPRSVPRVIASTRAAAEQALRARDLDPVVKSRYDAKVRAGIVLGQSPAPGTRLREGDDVVITISRGPQPVELPGGLKGQPYEEVVDVLKGLGLDPAVQFTTDAGGVRPGTVVSVTPSTGLHAGDSVTVVVASEPREGDKDDDDRGKGKGKKDD